MELHKIDIEQAFLQADKLDEGVNCLYFMNPPPGSPQAGEQMKNIVQEVLRPLYERSDKGDLVGRIPTHWREGVLFIGTPFSNLYTLVHAPAIGRVVVCLVFVIACKYALGHSEFSQSLNLLLIMPPLTLYLSHFASCLPSL